MTKNLSRTIQLLQNRGDQHNSRITLSKATAPQPSGLDLKLQPLIHPSAAGACFSSLFNGLSITHCLSNDTQRFVSVSILSHTTQLLNDAFKDNGRDSSCRRYTCRYNLLQVSALSDFIELYLALIHCSALSQTNILLARYILLSPRATPLSIMTIF